MITLTERAATKVREIASSEGLEGQGLRVRVLGAGGYNLYFEEKPEEQDQTLESLGVKLFVDPKSLERLDGAEIDFVEGATGNGFKVKTPELKTSCECTASASF